jgi:hypothetical protein
VPIPRFLANELAVDLATKAPGDLVLTAPEAGVLRKTNFRPRFFDPAAEKAGCLDSPRMSCVCPSDNRRGGDLALERQAIAF